MKERNRRKMKEKLRPRSQSGERRRKISKKTIS